jgi:hypothetical protein
MTEETSRVARALASTMSSAHWHHHAYLSKIPTTNSTDEATTSVVIHFGGPHIKKQKNKKKRKYK